MKRIVMHIDRLVLHGFGQADGDGFAQGLREELGRLLADPEVANRFASGRNIAQLRLGRVSIASGAMPCQAGTEVGKGIAKGMVR